MLDKIKTLLGISSEDTSKDELLSLYLDMTKQKIFNYCSITEIPLEMELIVVEMVVREFKLKDSQNVQSIKRGDTQISYSESGSVDIFDSYKSQLDKFRSNSKRVRFI